MCACRIRRRPACVRASTWRGVTPPYAPLRHIRPQMGSGLGAMLTDEGSRIRMIQAGHQGTGFLASVGSRQVEGGIPKVSLLPPLFTLLPPRSLLAARCSLPPPTFLPAPRSFLPAPCFVLPAPPSLPLLYSSRLTCSERAGEVCHLCRVEALVCAAVGRRQVHHQVELVPHLPGQDALPPTICTKGSAKGSRDESWDGSRDGSRGGIRLGIRDWAEGIGPDPALTQNESNKRWTPRRAGHAPGQGARGGEWRGKGRVMARP